MGGGDCKYSPASPDQTHTFRCPYMDSAIQICLQTLQTGNAYLSIRMDLLHLSCRLILGQFTYCLQTLDVGERTAFANS